MAHGDTREEKWRGNKRMEWVTSKRHMTAEHRLARAVQTLQADVHSSPAGSQLNWPHCRFKWTSPFRGKTKSSLCACAITFQAQSINLDNFCPEDGGNIFLRKSVPAVCIHCHNPDRELSQRHWNCACSNSSSCGTVWWGMKWSKITTKMSPTPNAGHVTGCRRIAQECGWLPSTTPRTLICGDRLGWRNATG
jgi:hypothetical protein